MSTELPAPRPTRHHRSLLWWLVVAGIAAFAYWEAPRQPREPDTRAQAPRIETDAFIALSFGRVSETDPEALPAAVFREQIEALKQAGYTTVSLDDVDAFVNRRLALPARPVLLMFTEAQRETMDIADAALMPLGMRATVFANVRGILEGNIDLVSRHRLTQLSNSDRWDVGLDGNSVPGASDESAPPTFSADEYVRLKKWLEEQLERPVLAAAFQRRRLDSAGEQAWAQTLKAASVPVGFVSAPPRANYQDVHPHHLRSLRMTKAWSGADLLAQLAAQTPRRERFEDDFASPAPSPAWVVDHGEIVLEDGALKISAKEGGKGAAVSIAGTERWSNGAVVVELAEPPRGQFWLSIRGQKAGSQLRLGIVNGKVVLQSSDQGGPTHVVGNRELGRGRLVLGLRVLGGRAVAELNGQRLSERPAEMPSALQQGPVTLAIWSENGNASARVRRVVAEPLTTTLALLPGVPDSSAWGELRKRADEFAIVSPRNSSDRAARRSNGRIYDSAIDIFARYHYLWVFPALTIEREIGPDDVERLKTQALEWADEPGVDGVNLVIASRVAGQKAVVDLVNSLRSGLAAKHKPLAVTVPGAQLPPKNLADLAQVFVASAPTAARLETATAPLRLVKPRT